MTFSRRSLPYRPYKFKPGKPVDVRNPGTRGSAVPPPDLK